ncbi:MAG: valine--tRNA ligase [Candidatus Aenigmatarchaeota archaeon]
MAQKTSETSSTKRHYEPKAVEEKWRALWKEKNIYKFDPKIGKIFSINTPPPYPSGDFHAGNFLNWCYFDFVARYKRMNKFAVHFPQGWDVHGLPVEAKVEQWKGKKSSEVSRQTWVQWCNEWTGKHITSMKDMMHIMGASIDWGLEYKTSDPEYIKMIQLSFLMQLEKGYAYRGKHPVNWCTNCRTAISDAEVEYQERNTHLYDIIFNLAGKGEIIIATTRPELLPACVGISVHPDDERYKEIVGRKAIVPIFMQEVEIFASDAVDQSFGSGIVQVCSFGDKQDVDWILKHRLPIIDAIDGTGKMMPVAKEFKDMDSLDARWKILKELETTKHLLGKKKLNQRYGACWRCKKPIEILNKEQWFIRATQFKEKLIEETKKCHWRPDHMKIHQIQWAETMKWDWCVSRQKTYGTPIPIWYCDNCNEILPADEKDLPVSPTEKEKICPKCEKKARGEKDQFDTWMDSSMTNYWHAGWPKKGWEKMIPASIQPNGYDIIRTWDYYLMLRSLMLSDKPPYENILINGMTLGEDGKKMSKSLGNYVTMNEIFEKSYADAARYWIARSTVGNDVPFSWKEVTHGERFFIKIFNICQFFERDFLNIMEEKNLSHPDELIPDPTKLQIVDKWILSKLEKLIQKTTEDFECYNFNIGEIESFLWHEFADYYLEMIKYRIFNNINKESAIWTIYKIISTTARLMAPFAPYITEDIYQTYLKKYEEVESIHIADWPGVDENLINPEAEKIGGLAKEIIATVRQFKTENKLAMNAPLKELLIENNDITDVIDDLKGTLKVENVSIGKMDDTKDALFTEKSRIAIKILK